MKLKSILLAGAVALLPLAASAQQTTNQTTTETKVVTTTGQVQAYEAGRSITITTENGEQMTFNLNDSSEVPKGLEVGKTVTVRTTTVSGSPVVKTITTTTTTKETKKKSY